MINTKRKIIVIVGPTAVGKTSFSIQLAQWLNAEIISADSRQFYKEMNIGTAKPSSEELSSVKHHFINNLSVTDSFNVSDFETQACKIIESLLDENRYCIVTGGTGLYINALLYGLDNVPETNSETRNLLNETLKEKGIEALQKMLYEQDYEYYSKVDIHNPRRIIRALEVCIFTGKKYSSFLMQKTTKRAFSPIIIGLELPREILYARIESRCDEMIEKGLLDEVKALLPYREFSALNTIGYTEFFDYLDEKLKYPEAVLKFKQHSRNYAKRQLTWWRNQKEINWFDASDTDKAVNFLSGIL